MLVTGGRSVPSRSLSSVSTELSKSAFLNEARPYRRNVRLTVARCSGRRMDRVVTEDEIVRVRSGRADNELCAPRWPGTLYGQECLAPNADQDVMPGVIGTVKWKTAPRGVFALAHKRPPCESMILRLRGRPMPVPSGLVVKNASKTRSAPSIGSPTPESLTDTIS